MEIIQAYFTRYPCMGKKKRAEVRVRKEREIYWNPLYGDGSLGIYGQR